MNKFGYCLNSAAPSTTANAAYRYVLCNDGITNFIRNRTCRSSIYSGLVSLLMTQIRCIFKKSSFRFNSAFCLEVEPQLNRICAKIRKNLKLSSC